MRRSFFRGLCVAVLAVEIVRVLVFVVSVVLGVLVVGCGDFSLL